MAGATRKGQQTRALILETALALFAEVLDGSSARVPADLRAELPELLWLYQMGVILFWIHDRSPDHRRTDHLIAHSAELVARAISLASIPVLKPLRRTALRLLAGLRQDLSLTEEAEGCASSSPAGPA